MRYSRRRDVDQDARLTALEAAAGGSLKWAIVTSDAQDTTGGGAGPFIGSVDIEWTAVASSEFDGLEIDGTEVTLGSGVFLVAWSATGTLVVGGDDVEITGSGLTPWRERVFTAAPLTADPPTFLASAGPSIVQGPALLTMNVRAFDDATGITARLAIVKIA